MTNSPDKQPKNKNLVQGRWKRGESGNPKGRPKGSKNLRSLLAGALFKKVKVTEGGEVREIPRVEAILTGLVAKALKGDVRATETVLRFMQQHFPGGEEHEPQKILVQFVESKGQAKFSDDDGSDGQRWN